MQCQVQFALQSISDHKGAIKVGWAEVSSSSLTATSTFVQGQSGSKCNCQKKKKIIVIHFKIYRPYNYVLTLIKQLVFPYKKAKELLYIDINT